MSEYWKSNAKKYCDLCKVWMADNKASIKIHEEGSKHQNSVKAKLFQIKKNNEQKSKDDLMYNASLLAIEQAAAHSMQRDLDKNPSLQSQYGVKQREDAAYVALSQASAASMSFAQTLATRKAQELAKKEKADKEGELVFGQKRKQPSSAPKPVAKIGDWKLSEFESDYSKIDLQLPNQSKEEKTGGKFKAIGDEFEQLENKLSTPTAITSAETQVNEETKEEKPAEKIVTLKSSGSSIKPIAFKKRKIENQSMKQRTDD